MLQCCKSSSWSIGDSKSWEAPHSGSSIIYDPWQWFLVCEIAVCLTYVCNESFTRMVQKLSRIRSLTPLPHPPFYFGVIKKMGLWKKEAILFSAWIGWKGGTHRNLGLVTVVPGHWKSVIGQLNIFISVSPNVKNKGRIGAIVFGTGRVSEGSTWIFRACRGNLFSERGKT